MLEEGRHVICDPAFAQWQNHLASNQRLLSESSPLLSAEERTSVRAEVLDIAHRYTSSLADSAASLNVYSGKPNNAQAPIVMVGHQPVVYHPGVLFKNKLLQQALSTLGVTGLNLIVDTDSGDAGMIHYPACDDDSTMVQRYRSLGFGSGVFISQKLRDLDELSATFDEIEVALRSCECLASLQPLSEARAAYVTCAGRSVVDGNTIVRRHFEQGPGYLEIPLSQLMQAPTIQRIIARILRDAQRFHRVYNQTLDAYRTRRKIDNPANPFPNLSAQGEAVELPFWLVVEDKGKASNRQPLYVLKDDKQSYLVGPEGRRFQIAPEQDCHRACLLPDGVALAPRAMVITLLCRLALADLFIHGTGGARYDVCTDDFMMNYLGVNAPSFVEASETRYLFPLEVAEFERVQYIEDNRRKLYFHPEQFFDDEIFDAMSQARLAGLVEQKAQAIELIKAGKKAGQSVAEPTQAIKRVEREVHQVVDAALERFSSALHLDKAAAREVYYDRTYPYFFYE